MSLVARLARSVRQAHRASKRHGASPFRVVIRLAALLLSKGVRPADAIRYGLSDPRLPPGRLVGCIGKMRLRPLQRRLSPLEHDVLVGDKGLFYLFCRSLEIPIPRLLAILDHPLSIRGSGELLRGRGEREAFLARELPDECVAKPARGSGGVGIRVLTRAPDGFQDDVSGELFTPGQLCDVLRSPRRHPRVVLQERLHSHPELARLSGTTAVQAIRFNTLITHDGTCRFAPARLKVIAGDQLIDNLGSGRAGNLVAFVGSGGLLAGAVAFAEDGVGLRWVERHPRTGERFEGFRIPFFEEALTLLGRVAPLFLPLRTIGWDVAITERGPCLVEGNSQWDPPNYVVPGQSSRPWEVEMGAFLDALRSEAAHSPVNAR